MIDCVSEEKAWHDDDDDDMKEVMLLSEIN